MPRTPSPFRTVPFARFADEAKDAPVEQGLPYHRAHAEFVRYFAGLETITSHNLIIGVHCVYAWMPTILSWKGTADDYDQAAELLTQIIRGAPLSEEDLGTLAAWINNSVVGASKLLHFVRPDRFAIWDSKVCTFIYGRTMPDGRPREIARYFAYLENCRELAADPKFPALHAEICTKKIGRDVPPLRAIEWVMYSAKVNRPDGAEKRGQGSARQKSWRPDGPGKGLYATSSE